MLAFCAVVVSYFSINQRGKVDGDVLSRDYSEESIKLVEFDEKLFAMGLSWVEKNQSKVDGHIKAGIIPHHGLASFIIADFFNLLIDQDPSTVVLIGPNHYEVGKYPAITSYSVRNTSGGSVPVNMEIVASTGVHIAGLAKLQSFTAVGQPAIIRAEHYA